MRLAVEPYGVLVGYLEGSEARTFDFVADDETAATIAGYLHRRKGG
jgi:hypothetical protein